jgi:hypothetical protein
MHVTGPGFHCCEASSCEHGVYFVVGDLKVMEKILKVSDVAFKVQDARGVACSARVVRPRALGSLQQQPKYCKNEAAQLLPPPLKDAAPVA